MPSSPAPEARSPGRPEADDGDPKVNWETELTNLRRVARIDFDFDDAFKITTNPQLLLLRLAEQLDEQIVGTPFVELRTQLESEAGEDATAKAGLVQIDGGRHVPQGHRHPGCGC